MKKDQIKVGGLYRAKVSGKLTTVRVDAIDSESCGYGFDTAAPRRYEVTNLVTNRKTTFRSAAKFRREVTEQEHRHVTEKNDKFLERYGHAATDATIGEQRSGADAGATDQGGDRECDPLPIDGSAVAQGSSSVVEAQEASDDESLTQFETALLDAPMPSFEHLRKSSFGGRLTGVWTYEYDNDTGSDDGGFWEFWTIFKDGLAVGRITDSEDTAKQICAAMNSKSPAGPVVAAEVAGGGEPLMNRTPRNSDGPACRRYEQ